MKRFYGKFIDMVFYSGLFRQSRVFHFRMAYEQGKFDYHMDQLNNTDYMEGTYEN